MSVIEGLTNVLLQGSIVMDRRALNHEVITLVEAMSVFLHEV